jgi:MSHA biogenesis protein MshI
LISVLPAASYHLLFVEAPDVPADELRAAVRWRIKDLIDFHVDDAVIDVFQMPAQGRGGVNQMMYAVAARAEFVHGQIQTLDSAGLKLEVIDIPELALRNVAAALEHDGEGVALLHLADDFGILLLVRQGVLYLTRRIETGARTLRESDGLRPDVVAGLALEVRRSIGFGDARGRQGDVLGAASAYQSVLSGQQVPDSLLRMAEERLNAIGGQVPPLDGPLPPMGS